MEEDAKCIGLQQKIIKWFD